MDKILRIKQLTKELNQASELYYNDKQSPMKDKVWDDKFDELKQLEIETGFSLSTSPITNVGYEVKSKLDKVTHSIPLKSLGKTKDTKDLQKFIGNKEVLQMLKGDGLTCELIYDNGELMQGSTRGNGTIGENITHNVKVFKNVPLKISFKGHLKLTGEAMILDEDFIIINSRLPEDDKYSNSRNLVAGSVRQLNSQICADRNVNFMAFNLLECEGKTFTTLSEQFDFLNSLGFHVIPRTIVNKDVDLQCTIDNLRNLAGQEGIPIDGLVYAYNDIAYANKLGETEHHPLSKLAYKFYDDEYETKYIKTDWQVSRTSLINPVGIFEPVDMDGASVERATLHNLDYMEALQLGKGDTIKTIRANQVIPKIVDNLTRSNTETIPVVCPICGEKTEIRLLTTARMLYCTNDNCPSKKIAQIEHYCSRNAMNIVGLSEATIEKFIEKGFIKNLSDIYKLEQHKEIIIRMEGFGMKSYNKLIESIKTSKKCDLSSFIFGLGIPNVGRGTSKDLATYFDNKWSNISKAMVEDFNFDKIKDVGQITNDSLKDWLSNGNNVKLILDLLEFVSFNEQKIIEVKEGCFTGMSIYCSGSFACGKKPELTKMVEDNGGTFASGYAKSLSYLVIGSIKGSSKEAKALKDGVKVLTESEFLEMIK